MEYQTLFQSTWANNKVGLAWLVSRLVFWQSGYVLNSLKNYSKARSWWWEIFNIPLMTSEFEILQSDFGMFLFSAYYVMPNWTHFPRYGEVLLHESLLYTFMIIYRWSGENTCCICQENTTRKIENSVSHCSVIRTCNLVFELQSCVIFMAGCFDNLPYCGDDRSRIGLHFANHAL